MVWFSAGLCSSGYALLITSYHLEALPLFHSARLVRFPSVLKDLLRLGRLVPRNLIDEDLLSFSYL